MAQAYTGILLPGRPSVRLLCCCHNKIQACGEEVLMDAQTKSTPLYKTRKNLLRSWLFPRGSTLGRWAYTMQRVSGVGVSLYFVAHIIETGNVVGGLSVWGVPAYDIAKNSWNSTVDFLENPLFDLGLVIIGFLLTFHTFNGVRLFFSELGYGIGKPARPDYPYKPRSQNTIQDLMVWISAVLAALAAVYALTVLFG
ncbi:MAG: hypothetical protein FJ358_05320 [Thaumarchaeota archaeon]|nr:hypothetical protein [Nitrososphaerota archaeon]